MDNLLGRYVNDENCGIRLKMVILQCFWHITINPYQLKFTRTCIFNQTLNYTETNLVTDSASIKKIIF